jgi:hypothetical protein
MPEIYDIVMDRTTADRRNFMEIHLSYADYKKMLDEIMWLKQDKSMLMESIGNNLAAHERSLREADVLKEQLGYALILLNYQRRKACLDIGPANSKVGRAWAGLSEAYKDYVAHIGGRL